MKPDRPRALMIAPAVPAQTGNGLAMRLGVFLEALSSVAAVDLLVIPGGGEVSASTGYVESLGVRRLRPARHSVDTRFALIMQIGDAQQRLAALRAYGRPSLAAKVSLPLQSEIRTLAAQNRYALVHVARSYMIEAGIAAGAHASLTVDLDDDDLASFASQADCASTGSPASADAAWLRAEGQACDALIARWSGRFRRVFVAAPDDLASLAARHPGLDPVLIPNAVAIPDRPSRKPDAATILFVGAMTYPPNRQAVGWFIDKVWPRLRLLAPSRPKLVIAGSGDLKLSPGHAFRSEIDELGFVPDLLPLYERASLAVAPLFSGGGSRIKLLEAAALGVPIVATTFGARGLPLTDPNSAWIADDADGFAHACAEALANPAEACKRAAAARDRIAGTHDRRDVVRRLAHAFEDSMGDPAITADFEP